MDELVQEAWAGGAGRALLGVLPASRGPGSTSCPWPEVSWACLRISAGQDGELGEEGVREGRGVYTTPPDENEESGVRRKPWVPGLLLTFTEPLPGGWGL